LGATVRRPFQQEKTMKHQLAAIAACLLSVASLANEVRYFSEDQQATAAEIAALLAPPAALAVQAAEASSGHGGRTRLVRVLGGPESPHRVDVPVPVQQSSVVPVNRTEPAAQVPQPQLQLQVARLASVGAVALALRFDVDANRIQAQHLAQLDALAAGIKRLPSNALITIAGHTDAYGPALYNIDLSLKRAMAVKAYLVQVHGIPGRRLAAMGKGKSEPLNRANPYAPENRRVQVHAEYDMA
jgi:outer membrane protein OmpA-like peptidoglycan-associated protein